MMTGKQARGAATVSVEYREKVTQGIMNAIVDAGITEQDGKQVSYLMTAEICDAMLSIMAEILESSPACGTPSEIRTMTDSFAKKLRTRITAIRTIRQSGEPGLSAIVINPN